MKKEKININMCPVTESLRVIGGKWRLRIIHEIGLEKRRFGEMKRLIPEISEKMLIQELKSLTELGVLSRKAFNEIPPKVEYSLTTHGQKIIPIIEQVASFGFELIKRNKKYV